MQGAQDQYHKYGERSWPWLRYGLQVGQGFSQRGQSEAGGRLFRRDGRPASLGIGGPIMKEWWEGKFDKKPDPDYILSVLIDIYERQNGVKVVVEK